MKFTVTVKSNEKKEQGNTNERYTVVATTQDGSKKNTDTMTFDHAKDAYDYAGDRLKRAREAAEPKPAGSAAPKGAPAARA